MSEQPLRNISNCISDFTHNTQSSSYLTPLQLPQTPNEMKFVFIALLRRFIEVKVISHFTSPKWALRYLVRPTFLKYWQQAKAPPPPYFIRSSTSNSTHSSDQVKKIQYETSAFSTSTSSKRSLDFLAKSCLESQPKLPRLQWPGKVGPHIRKTLEGIEETYDKCGALTYQQQLSLIHGIITYLYMYAEPVIFRHW